MKSKLGIVSSIDIDRISVVPGGAVGTLRNVRIVGDASLLKPGDQVVLDYADGKLVASPIYKPTPASEAASAAVTSAVREDGVADQATGLSRLFNSGPDHDYQFTFRDWATSAVSSDVVGFEEKEDPYTFPTGNYSMSIPAGWQAETTSYPSFLYSRNTSAANALSIDWNSSTARNTFKMIFWLTETNALVSDYLHTEIRFWADQVPTAASNYFSLRVKAIRTSYATEYYMFGYYGTGLTYSLTDGTMYWSAQPIVPGIVYAARNIVIATSTVFPNLNVADGGLVGQAGTAQTGWPSSFKCMKIYQPAGAYQTSGIDSIRIY